MTRRLFRVRFAGKLLAAFLLVVTVSLSMLARYLFYATKSNVDEEVRTSLVKVAQLVESQVEGKVAPAHAAELASLLLDVKRATLARVTVIDLEGTVVADSDVSPSSLANHKEREEVAAALDGRVGFATRPSTSVGQDLVYAAVPVLQHGQLQGAVRTSLNEEWINRSLDKAKVHLVTTLLVAIFLAGIASYFIARRMARPLERISRGALEIARGNLEAALPPMKRSDEIGDLYNSFEDMRRSLRTYVANLEQTTADKQRIESELAIAHLIQMSLLHKLFPPYPERHEFDLYATVLPAREVGGDFYDFCLLDQDHLFFCVGDVSGKGVPAALFMAVTKTLMHASSGGAALDPAAILQRVNHELCESCESDVDSLMFVTVFCAILDLPTGLLRYSNAGHNPPLIVRAQGEVEWLELPAGLVLGIEGGARFGNREIRLGRGDAIWTYTDGVTEATTADYQLYSNPRLASTLAGLTGRDARGLVEGVFDSVASFAAGAPQADDITGLALVYQATRDAGA